ncbi:SDR family NAD(P)-dependent oxidoreductase [Pseudomonas lopnurensis]|uniref:SDR family NAD(P)-dependent oxidoreductase n=1 Tax=Pseudomonas lopnurensis TaxID=1477517 RepID=UPI0028B25CE9|nr:SDR family oxidoreductase [Pseudomonas lopnurensis]
MKLSELMSLQGKKALVAGGAGLLGSEISDVLAELGADVIIASRDIEKCRVKAEKLTSDYPGNKYYSYLIDIADPDSIRDCISSIECDLGGFDILVTCAWSGRKNDWDSINDADWNYDIEVCLNGVFRLIKSATPTLKKNKGLVLTIGSMYGHVAPDYRLYEGVPQSNPPSYGAAKAGIIQLTKYIASFLAQDGIRANCISPGPFPFEEVLDQHPVFKERLCNKNPMGRVGKSYEIKGAVALLCSDASSYMTGQNICVDGGWSIW